MRSARVQISQRRVQIARVALLVPFAILAARAANLSVDEQGRKRGEAQTQRVVTLAPERGAIVDATGAELALSIDAPSIYAIPSVMSDPAEAARQLAPIVGWKTEPLAERLTERRSFLFLARWVAPERAQRALDLGIDGVGIVDEPRRIYPHRRLAAPLVGFANIDGSGVRGVEQLEDAWLRGMARRIPVERDARGRLLWVGGDEQWSTAGGDVALTIDAALQADAEAALRETVEASGALGGVVVVMDPWTGDLITLAEAPGFDPNRFRKMPFEQTRSPAFLDAVDPGSTLKAFLVASALEAGSLRVSDVIDCEQGSFQVPGKMIRDTHPHGSLTPGDILRVSSNIGAVKIAYALGASTHYSMLRRFGFGVTTRSAFPGESSGLLRGWKQWQPVDHATIAFGQGITVTPIQLAAATAALANGGTWVRPRLVSARRPPGGRWHAEPIEVERRVVSETTARQVLDMMESVVSVEGSGRRAALRGVSVAGKTGTAQKYDSANKTFAQDRFQSWFIGVVPADDPKLAIVVGVDEPKRPHHTGGATAAPLFARVAAAQLVRFGIFTEPAPLPRPVEPIVRVADATPKRAAPTREPKPRTAKRPTPKPVAPPATPPVALPAMALHRDRVLLPDFAGLTVAEVRQITADGPLDVLVSGQGRAVDQDPPAGSVVARSDGPVRVRFETRSGGGGEG